ncbi:MAG: 3-hydroxyacyl-CoA dehydrogenase [Bacteroidia bacterium]|nr:MAG: 3-hydroxyacyl-CoA dehydrogenase [Bacteroidia bacterium]
MKKINSLAVIGAGTMGSALAQKFAQENFNVILCDKSDDALKKGIKRIEESLNEAVEKKVISSQKKTEVLDRIKSTVDFNDLNNVDLVIEAVFENFEVKAQLFQEISKIVKKDTIIATNTSSFSVTELSQHVSYPERFIGLHYFYHAAKNRLVEVVPGAKTSEEVFKTAYYFSLQSGKDPIVTKDVYGFAVNRFFVPWLNESVRLFQEKIATPEQIDYVAMKLFGIGMGPFALMNATGVPVAYHAEKTLEVFGPSYKVSELLKQQAEKQENWNIDEFHSIDTITEKVIEKRLLGVVFFVVAQLLNEKVCTATDLNKGAKIGLKWKKGPIELMCQKNIEEVNQIIHEYVTLYNEKTITISKEDLKLEYVLSRKINDIGYIIFNRPEDLNALNEDVFNQLNQHINALNSDTSINKIIITSTGKAFVAGADIKFFINNIESGQIDKIVSFTQFAQSVLEKIDRSPKKVICVLNGMALGGGLELALCADEIYALPNVTMAFPETGIGIYPGLGGTQRTQQRVGKLLTKYLVFTGKNLNVQESKEISLIDGIISFEDYINILEGNLSSLAPRKQERRELAEKWKEIEKKMENINPDNFNSAGDDELLKILSRKAPLALKYADKLINEFKGPASELNFLKDIFSSEDALLGLKNIGKKVEYKGK